MDTGAVTALRYNKAGSLLASGSKDNDVILWDVVGETGPFCLRGHRDQESKCLTVSNERTMTKKDDVLVVAVSPDAKYVAVALLKCTVEFVRNTHYMFNVGNDRLVKYWDADKFELLLTLEGHHADVWCLAISSRGDFIVTGSHERFICCWDCTEKPFFIEEEKEKRLEQMFEADVDNAFENRYGPKKELLAERAWP